MGTINLNIKVHIGPRTKTIVEVYSTAAKTVKLKNGKELTDEMLANWIVKNLTTAIKNLCQA